MKTDYVKLYIPPSPSIPILPSTFNLVLLKALVRNYCNEEVGGNLGTYPQKKA